MNLNDYIEEITEFESFKMMNVAWSRGIRVKEDVEDIFHNTLVGLLKSNSYDPNRIVATTDSSAREDHLVLNFHTNR